MRCAGARGLHLSPWLKGTPHASTDFAFSSIELKGKGIVADRVGDVAIGKITANGLG